MKNIVKGLSITLIFQLVVSCAGFKKGLTTSDIKSIYKDLTRAESMEMPKQKQKLLNRAYNKISQFQQELIKNNKSSSELITLMAYYYFIKGNFDEAEKQIELAKQISKKQDYRIALIGSRIMLVKYGMKKADNVIQMINPYLTKKDPMVYLIMGDAYFYKGDYGKAKSMYINILKLGKQYQVEAANRIETLSRISELKMKSSYLANIVLQLTVSRETVAYLMFSVFKLHNKVKTSLNKKVNYSDIDKSPYKEAIIKLCSKGFFSFIDDNRFNPFMPVTRGELAKLFEDYLVLKSSDESLRKKFSKETKSFFNDMKIKDDYYNAMRLAVTMKILPISLSGDAFPEEPLSGLDLVIALKKISRL